jgi:hypothetical protein
VQSIEKIKVKHLQTPVRLRCQSFSRPIGIKLTPRGEAPLFGTPRWKTFAPRVDFKVVQSPARGQLCSSGGPWNQRPIFINVSLLLGVKFAHRDELAWTPGGNFFILGGMFTPLITTLQFKKKNRGKNRGSTPLGDYLASRGQSSLLGANVIPGNHISP